MTDTPTPTPESQEPVEESMITVARFDTEMEAEMLAVRLRDEDLQAAVVSGGSLGVSMNPTKSGVGVLVLVPESQVEDAEAIIDTPLESSEDAADSEQDDEPYVSRVPWPARIASIVVLAMIMVILIGGIMMGVQLVQWIFEPSTTPVK